MTQQSPYEDIDPTETQEWLESIDSVMRAQGPAARAFPAREAGRLHPPLRRLSAVQAEHRLPQYHLPGAGAATIRATARSSGATRPTCAGMRSPWWCKRIVRAPSTAATSRATPPPRRSTRSDSITSGARAAPRIPGDMIFMQGHSSPGIYARAYLEGRLDEAQLQRFRQEVRGDGLSSYPHPWLMPDFWQFPTVSMGLGPMMAIFQARFVRYLEHRGIVPALGSQGLGVPGRRRDGRAGVDGCAHHAGAREARQSGLRHQLQPAASRRSGARQRQDHPGARGGVSRRRLERHQGAVGIALGSLARARSQGTAQAPDGRVRGRRVSEFQIQGRRLYPRAFLRQVSGAQGDGRQHVRRGDLAPESRRPRSGEGLCGLRLRRREQGLAHRHPREDREGLRSRQDRRGAQRRAPAEKARRGGAQGGARPLQHPDLRRGDRRSSRSASRRPTARR